MRYERKYRIEGSAYWEVYQVLISHPMSIVDLYPDRTIHNIYFDTEDLVTYQSNVDGDFHRKKFRVRWYGEDVNAVTSPNLEIKIKQGELGSKKVSPVEVFSLKEISGLSQCVGDRLQAIYNPIPVLLNSYKRSYLTTPDRKFRITIDWDLKYHSLLTGGEFVNHSAEENCVVVELKYDQEYEMEVEHIAKYLPFRISKNSKYVNGVNLTMSV